jgi:hypothetical protein
LSTETQARPIEELPRSAAARYPRRGLIALWAVVAAVGIVVLQGTLTHDFRTRPLVGDQSAHLLQALSLAYDSHTLNFDAQDHARWQEVGWEPEPRGLFFQQYEGDRWAGAKPYGYALYLAPFIAVLGPVPGVAVANSLLLVLLIAVSIAILRTRFKGPVVPLAVTAFYLASYAYFYAYILHSELFLALLTLLAFGAVLRYRDTGRTPWAVAAFALMAFGVSEKLAFLPLFVPLAAYTLWRAPGIRVRLMLPTVGLIVFAVAVLPYLKYSDWQSFTPYGGDRYYAVTSVPFAGGTDYRSASFQVEGIREKLLAPVDDKLIAAGLYVAGRHTGMVAFIPAALFVLLAAIARARRADGWAIAALLGVLGYIAFYVVMYPLNYYGGGQSLGNRYFLQMAPVVLVVAVMAGLPRRWLMGCSVAGILVALAMIWPHHLRPGIAFDNLAKTSPLQLLLPFEHNQDYWGSFICYEEDCR